MKNKFSFVTNVTELDGIRLNTFLPGVLRTFGDFLEEIIVVVDRKPEEGRIKKLHQKTAEEACSLAEVKNKFADPKIRFVDLDYSKQEETSLRWFGVKEVNRCQNGTPVFAFLYGIDQCKHELIIRSDCDILFYDLGFVQTLQMKSANFELIQLPFLIDNEDHFSTRCFFINRSRIISKLPLYPLKLDIVRRVHRWLCGRNAYLSLEQMLHEEVEKRKISLYRLSTSLGRTMHIPTRDDFHNIERIVTRFNQGEIPEQQLRYSHDYSPSAWQD